MSETPRTDAAAIAGAYMSSGDYSSTQGKQLVHIDVSRQLERELNAAKAEIVQLKGEIQKAFEEGYMYDFEGVGLKDGWRDSRAKRVVEGTE